MNTGKDALRLKLVEINNILAQVEELEGQSHQMWDDSFSNICYGRLSTEMRDGYIKQSYQATGLHSQAMDKLRLAIRELRDSIPDEQGFIFYSVN